ncbi:MAG TPA: hypothetical protein VHP80_09660 [Candidatus Acidoferrum sp.]|nr:hypothetical protein [Candidatus Acidoferrum sp.]
MTPPNKQKLLQATAYLAGVGVLWIRLDDFGNSEFIGGWLTGRIFSMADDGGMLFLLALILTIFLPRIASVAALLASLLCLPLYLYAVAPGPFRRVFRGMYAGMIPPSFVWDWWAVTGIATVIFAAFLSIQSLRSRPAIKRS